MGGRSFFLTLGGEAAVAAAALGAGYAFSKLAPKSTSFLELDLQISSALMDETVPMRDLIGLTVILPMLLIPVIVGVKAVALGQSQHAACASFAWLLLCFAQASAIAVLVTNAAKYYTARHRPNFYAYCDYASYRAAIASGNLTAYEASVSFGAQGDVSKCLGSADDVNDSQRSFPSGHASSAFAGMLFTVYLLRWVSRVPRGEYLSLRALLCASPLVLSTWIALTRVRDRFHNQDDVAVGAAIGCVAGWMAWGHLRAHAEERDLHLLVMHSWSGGGSGEEGLRGAGRSVSGEGDAASLLTPLAPNQAAGSREAPLVDLLLSPTAAAVEAREEVREEAEKAGRKGGRGGGGGGKGAGGGGAGR